MMKLQVIKRAVLTLAAVAGIALAVQAQEYPVNNQYYFNYYLINPAVAGAAKCHYFMLTHKQQWMGIDDAPYTTSLSYQGRWRNSVGVGAYVYNDKNGYSRQQSAQVTFAYHIPMSNGSKYIHSVSYDRQLSFGLSAKGYLYGVDEDEFRNDVRAQMDRAMSDLDDVQAFNVNLGVYYESYGFYTGLSVTNLFHMKMPHYDGNTEPHIPFTGYFFLGNEFHLNESEVLDPSLMVMADANSCATIDVGLKYGRSLRSGGDDWAYWFGLTLRQNVDDGKYQALDLIPMGGFQYNKFHLGLAYDMTLNRLWRHNAGTLEVMLGYTLCHTSRFCR